MDKNINILVYSSFLFLIVVFICFQCKYYLYSALALLLFFTSIIVHSYENTYTIILDKIAILLFVLYGGYTLYSKMKQKDYAYNNYCFYFILFTFIATIFLYYVGYINNHFCFHPDRAIANCSHVLMHFFSILGHSFIVLL